MNLITLLISNSDLFDKMYQEINRQNTFYFWIIGIVVTVSIAIAAFIGRPIVKNALSGNINEDDRTVSGI